MHVNLAFTRQDMILNIFIRWFFKKQPLVFAILLSGIFLWVGLIEIRDGNPILSNPCLAIFLGLLGLCIITKYIIKSEKVLIWISRLFRSAALALLFVIIVVGPFLDLTVENHPPGIGPISPFSYYQHIYHYEELFILPGIVCAVVAYLFNRTKINLIFSYLTLALFLQMLIFPAPYWKA
jgi:hypothetical protein